MKKKESLPAKLREESLPAKLREMYSEDVKENLQNVIETFYKISIMGGRYKVDEKLIGNAGVEFEAVVMREIPINVFFATPYDPSNPSSPDCWSLGGMKPDISSSAPQSASCIICKQNRFGSGISADGKRRGKACRNGRRLVLYVEGVELPALLSLPPTAIKDYNNFLKNLSMQGLPLFALKVKFQFDSNVQYAKPLLVMGDNLSQEQYLKIREMRKSVLYENALNAYASMEEFQQQPEEQSEEQRGGKF